MLLSTFDRIVVLPVEGGTTTGRREITQPSVPQRFLLAGFGFWSTGSVRYDKAFTNRLPMYMRRCTFGRV